MRTLLRWMILTSLGLASAAAWGADPLVWCGLDYSHVKMIGTEDFRNPEDIFPSKPEAWNALFMREMLPKLEKMAPGLRTDTGAVAKPNAKLTADCIERKDGTREETVTPSHLTAQDLAKIVKGYSLEHKDGLGLVFIMDRLVKGQQTACLYVVFFDIGSRQIVYSQRECEKAQGAGFRNYWFGPVKRVVKNLPKAYQQVRQPQ